MSTVRTLNGPPNSLELYARAALPLLPGASRLPFIAGGGGDVPDIELRLDGVRPDPEQLRRYREVCHFAATEQLPATYLHICAFPLHMALMGDGRFPLPAVGLVHISNEITVHRALGAGETYDLRVHATPLEPHARGRAFTIVSEARAGGELVWEDRSTMLRRGRGSGAKRAEGEAKEPTAPPELTQWELEGDLGRRYGAVSGDRNPIHIHPYTARLFGFPRAIAHGMWTKAACLAELQPKLPDSYTVTVGFRRPILLPAQVAFAAAEQDGTTDFQVRATKGSDTIHLQGTVTP